MKRNDSWMAIGSVFLLSLALLMSVIDFCSFRVSFYRMEYEKNDTSAYTGMSAEDNLKATVTLLDYLRDKRDDIVVLASVNGVEREVFNERETLHMVDVKDLYQKAILVRNITALIGVILALVFCLYKKHSLRQYLLEGFVKGNMIIGILVVFIAIWALADFNAFWTNFHLLFFNNDLWLLDPNTSIMINLFPGSFFFDLVIRIILIYCGILLVIGMLTWYLKGHHA